MPRERASRLEDPAKAAASTRASLACRICGWNSAIAMPAEFSVWRFGISLSLFTDTGATWFRGDRLTPGSFASGYGGGIDFLLPYSVVLRTEYAWNEFGTGQFIIDFRGNI